MVYAMVDLDVMSMNMQASLAAVCTTCKHLISGWVADQRQGSIGQQAQQSLFATLDLWCKLDSIALALTQLSYMHWSCSAIKACQACGSGTELAAPLTAIWAPTLEQFGTAWVLASSLGLQVRYDE